MIELITPVDSFWLYRYILEPFKEGFIRAEQGWTGKELFSFVETSFSLKERIVFLIQGVLLIIPLVNSIVWVAMQILGAKKLSDPYCPPCTTLINIVIYS